MEHLLKTITLNIKRLKFFTTMSFSKTTGSCKENRTDAYHLLVHLWQDLVIQRWLTKLH